MKYPLVSRLPLRNWCYKLVAGICTLAVSGALHASTSLEMLAMFDPLGHASSVETKVPSLASALSEQRYHYNLAKSALNAGELDDYQQNYDLLGDYPLVPYLDYTYLRTRLGQLPYTEVDAFFAKYPNSFLSVRLRQLWLFQLATRNQWQPYINYYHADAATTELQCHYLYARLQTGDTSALNDVPAMWNVGNSQPKACDPLFNTLAKSGQLTQDLVWSRFTKAMHGRNLGLARYLSRSLSDNHKQMAQLYLQVDRQPTLMKQHNKFRQQDPLMQQVIAHGITRLARSQAKVAQREWELYEAQQLFSEALSRDTKITLVRYLTRQNHPADAEQMLRNSAALRQSDVVEELIREALRELDWPAVARRIQMLPEDEQSTDRWQYWSARATNELGLANADSPAPAEVYAALATKRSFYGFLAADLIGESYSLEEAQAEVNPSALRTIAGLPGMRRAKELWLVGNREEARAEWLFTIEHMSRDELVSAGQLARQWGWYNKGIHAMITGDLWDHLSIRFPLAYQDVVTRVASNMQLDPTLIYAIARQESAFAENAHSSAGARGLMQLMPATAAQTARNKGVKHRVQDLYNPEHNIMLGSSYFHSLLERFDNNRILATAAYNAGPHRVAGWISEPDKERPFDVWIETIPYRETRGYVQNVLSYSVIYGYRMGQATHLVTAKEAGDLL